MTIVYNIILVIIPVYMMITITRTCLHFQAEVFFPGEGSKFLRHNDDSFITLNDGDTEKSSSAHSGIDSTNLAGYISELMLGISWLMATELRELWGLQYTNIKKKLMGR
jgi:hypothetical protein